MFGRFVPDFGRVVAQMQFDMYHHYTVDEHSIRAIGLLAAIERGELADDHPLSTACSGRSRRAARSMSRCCSTTSPRDAAATIACSAPRSRSSCARASGSTRPRPRRSAWLVRHHLLLSHTAFRRDLADPKTIEDFVRPRAKPRAAAPAADPDRGRHSRGRAGDVERLEAAIAARLVRRRRGAAAARPQAARADRAGRRATGELAAALGWPARTARAYFKRLPDSYWLAEPPEWQIANARQVAPPKRASAIPSQSSSPSPTRRGSDPDRVFAPDRPGCSTASAPGSPAPARHRRRAHPHHARRHGARQSARQRRAGPAMPMAPAQPAGPRVEARWTSDQPPTLPKAAAAGAPRGRLRRRAVGAHCRAGVEPHHRGRGQCARPPRPARAPR